VTDSEDRQERRAASARVSDYHDQQLRLLLDRVRQGFEQMDDPGINERQRLAPPAPSTFEGRRKRLADERK
jgi:hypothetical protein